MAVKASQRKSGPLSGRIQHRRATGSRVQRAQWQLNPWPNPATRLQAYEVFPSRPCTECTQSEENIFLTDRFRRQIFLFAFRRIGSKETHFQDPVRPPLSFARCVGWNGKFRQGKPFGERCNVSLCHRRIIWRVSPAVKVPLVLCSICPARQEVFWTKLTELEKQVRPKKKVRRAAIPPG